MLGRPGSDFIYPLMSQIEQSGVAARLLGPTLVDGLDVVLVEVVGCVGLGGGIVALIRSGFVRLFRSRYAVILVSFHLYLLSSCLLCQPVLADSAMLLKSLQNAQ